MHQRWGPYGSWKAADDSGQFSSCKEHIKVHFLLQRAQIAVMMCTAVLSLLLPTVLPGPGLTSALRLLISTHRHDPLALACKVARQ